MLLCNASTLSSAIVDKRLATLLAFKFKLARLVTAASCYCTQEESFSHEEY